MRGELDNFDWYFKEISQYPLLSVEEEVELVKDIEGGQNSGKARAKLICSNLRLAAKIAVTASKKWDIDLMDLINESNKSLIEFIDRIGCHKKGYDWRRNYRFGAYCVSFLRNKLKEYCVKNFRLIRVSQYYFYKKENSHTQQKLQGQIYNNTGQEMITDYREIDPVESCIKREFFESHWPLVVKVIEEFSDRDRKIIWARFGLNGYKPHNFIELGATFGISREWARRLEKQALIRIKEKLASLD